MFAKNNDKKTLFDLNIFVISFLLFFFKWILSFLIFQDDNLINKILFDISDIHYFPFILNIVDLNFSPDYLNNIKSENLIPIPIYSVIFHALFFKFFGLSSFFILELIFLYIFLLIIFKILTYCKVNYYLAIFFSLSIFIFPSIISNIYFLDINFNIINGLFSFRFPRPLVTSCYFFWGLYLLIIYSKEEVFKLRNFLLIGLCFSLTFVSYYYNFINLLILSFLLLINKVITKKKYLNNNYINILYSIIVFLLLTLPYLYLYSLSEKDFLSMIGVINLNNDIRIELLSHFLDKVFSLKFIFVFLIITLARIFLLKFNNKMNKKLIDFFYLLFISTLLSPFLFTIISPSISEIYHFLNWILIISFFTLIIYFCLFVDYLVKDIISKSYKFYKASLFFLIFSFIFIFQFINYEKLMNHQDVNLRSDFSKLQKLIDREPIKMNNLLSFSVRAQVLWMFKQKDEFSSIESSISSLNFDQLEMNFLKNLKFLNVNLDDFSKLISNQKSSWRYTNEYLKYISWYRYQANSLTTYNDTKDYNQNELQFIKNSSPTMTQQIILPKFEIDRLNDLYKIIKVDTNQNIPDLIVLKNDSSISLYKNIDYSKYCKVDNFNELKIFALNKFKMCENN